jgi:hypothetical protein
MPKKLRHTHVPGKPRNTNVTENKGMGERLRKQSGSKIYAKIALSNKIQLESKMERHI